MSVNVNDSASDNHSDNESIGHDADNEQDVWSENHAKKKNENINNIESSPSPSPSQQLSSDSVTSLRLTERTRTRNKRESPIVLSYKEWFASWFHLSIPAIGFLGCQLSLALQNGFVTPELEELGISSKLVNYCWLAPPLTATIVQPLIGITSDHMDTSVVGSFAHKYGRRRPFVALGCSMVFFFLLLFSNARYIGILLGDSELNTSKAAIIAIVSFWFLDISINVVQAPLRALISDVIPSKHHSTANGLFGFANGLGMIIGYALGYGMAYNDDLGGGLSALFGLASITVIITSCIMLYLTRGEQPMDIRSTSLSEILERHYSDPEQLLNVAEDEKALLNNNNINSINMQEMMIPEEPVSAQSIEIPSPAVRAQIANQNNYSNPNASKWSKIKNAMVNMPRPIARAFMVQFWLYFGLFACNIYLTDWFGRKVTHGNPQSDEQDVIDAYRFGVRVCSIGLCFGAIFAVIGSMVLPLIIAKFGYKWTWFVCMIFYGTMLLMTPFCNEITFGLFIVTCLGIGQAAAMVIGWSIVTETVADSDQKGLYTTLFTTAHTLPELVVALCAGQIILLFDEQVSAVLAVGGVAALFGANSALYIVEPKTWLAKRAWLKRQNRILANRQNG